MSSPLLYKYSGAGNDFIVLLDEGNVEHYRQPQTITTLCSRSSGFVAADGRIGADGLMILSGAAALIGGEQNSSRSELAQNGTDFRMEFYNPDGTSGMMCGNGGRCIAAFADELGIKPISANGIYRFEAADGLHTAEILSRDGSLKQVRLGMIDARGLEGLLGGYYLYTGTRHFVKFVTDVGQVDIASDGPRYRYDAAFAPIGVNANFVSNIGAGQLAIRTWEKGVEGETLACGTGITAAAIAAFYAGVEPLSGTRAAYQLQARGGELRVEFEPADSRSSTVQFERELDRVGPYDVNRIVARSVFLTGPAELIG